MIRYHSDGGGVGGGGGEGRVILNRTSKVKDVEEFRT